MYMLVTARPKPSTMPRQPSVGTLGGQTLYLRKRSRYHSSASAASLELIATFPSFSTWAPLAYMNSVAYSTAHVPCPRIPKPYWLRSPLVKVRAVARNSSHVQSSLGGLTPYSPARSVRQYTPSLVTTHGSDRILFFTVTVCQAIGVTSL